MGSMYLVGLVVAAMATQSDDEILVRGHRAYVTPFAQPNERSEAEYRYALALGKRNAVEIAGSPSREQLEYLELNVANITKGACRVSDYATDSEEIRMLHERKAFTLANLTVEGFISHRPPEEAPSQGQMWQTFRRAGQFHMANREKIEKCQRESGGYSYDQLQLEYGSLKTFANRMMKAVAKAPVADRQHAFRICDRLFRLTIGEDPFPY